MANRNKSWIEQRRKRMQELWDRGLSMEVIGELEGISRERVSSILGRPTKEAVHNSKGETEKVK